MVTDIMPPFKGAFSYKKDKVYRTPLGNGQQLVVERMDPSIAKLRFELESDNTPVNIPECISIVIADSMIPAARVGDEYFIITWMSDYILLKDGEAYYKVFNQKSHAIQRIVFD